MLPLNQMEPKNTKNTNLDVEMFFEVTRIFFLIFAKNGEASILKTCTLQSLNSWTMCGCLRRRPKNKSPNEKSPEKSLKVPV